MKLTEEQVRWVAHLARLELSAAELAALTPQMAAIVAYVDQLGQLDTSGVEPLSHALPLSNVFREDEVSPSLPVAEALANAPRKLGDCYAVPAVLD